MAQTNDRIEELSPDARRVLTEQHLGIVVQFMLHMLPVEALEDALTARRRQDTILPFIDLTAYRRDMAALANTQAVLAAALTFRKRLEELRAKA